MEIQDLVSDYETVHGKFKPRVRVDVVVYLETVLSLNRGTESMHGGENGYEILLGSQTDIEEDLYKAGVSRGVLNEMSGKLLDVED